MSFRWLTPALVVALVCGGLGGAVFTWWVNHPRPAILAYAISTTTTGTEPGVHALVPNLTLQIGDEKVTAIHTHAITLLPAGTYEREASLGIFFATSPRIFGTAVETPSPLHSCLCERFDRGLKCVFSPLDARSGKPYRVLIASDASEPPSLTTIDQRVDLISLQQLANRQPLPLIINGAVMSFFAALAILVLLGVVDSVMMKIRPTTWKPIITNRGREIAHAENKVARAEQELARLKAKYPKPE